MDVPFVNGDRFPERLKELRGNMTLQQLADAVGVNRVTLTNYENGTRRPDAGILYRIARHFGVSLDYLVGISDVKSYDADLQSACRYTGLSEQAAGLLHHYAEKCTDPAAPDDQAILCADALDMVNDLIDSTALQFALMSYLEFDRVERVTTGPDNSGMSGSSFNAVSDKGYVCELNADIIKAGLLQQIRNALDDIKAKRGQQGAPDLPHKKPKDAAGMFKGSLHYMADDFNEPTEA